MNIAKKIYTFLKQEEIDNSDIGLILEKEKEIWESIKAKSKFGKKILIATSTGGHDALTHLESLLGATLTVRGAQVEFLLCDKFLPACLQSISTSIDPGELVKNGPQKKLCDDCYKKGLDTLSPLRLPIHLFSTYSNNKKEKELYFISSHIKYKDIQNYTYHGLKVGEHAYAGALRFFAKASLADEPQAEKVLRRYLFASLLTSQVLESLLAKEKYSCIVFNHGLYVPQGIIGEVARSRRIRVVNWNPAYRKQCFIFSEGDTYHHTLMNESTGSWEYLKMTRKIENRVLGYLKSRWTGSKDWIWFHEKPIFSKIDIASQIGLNSSVKTIGMLTNVMWDAQLHYPANAFPNMLDWIIKTISYFRTRKDLQLIIRVHPAEIRGTLPSRQKVVEEIKKVFPILPNNVKVIPPESRISTYAVMELCDSVLIYGTKTGVELTSMGIPVIVAGESWIRNKGISKDASSSIDYFKMLEGLPIRRRMKKHQVDRALKYAYHFFFRRMIPIRFMIPTKGWPPYKIKIKSLKNLQKGNDPGLDTICEGILLKKQFVYKDELYV